MRSVATVLLVLALLTPAPAAADAGDWDDRFARPGFSGRIIDATVADGTLYVSGETWNNGEVPIFDIARWNAGAFEAVADRSPFFELTATPVYSGQVVTTGYASSWIPDGPYAWNGSAWEIMGAGLPGSKGNVRAWAIFDGDLVLGGNFSVSDSTGSSWGTARWDGSSWHRMGGGLAGYSVYALAVYDGELYAAGSLTEAEGVPVGNLARWNGSAWSPVEAINPLNLMPEEGIGGDYVFALTEHEGMLAIAGEFDSVGTRAVTNLVLLDGTGVDPQWSYPAPAPGAGRVRAAASLDGMLYLGGEPGMVPGAGGSGTLARVAVSGWEEIPGSPDGPVYTMLAHDAKLRMGGDFDLAGGFACGSWVAFDGSSFSPQQNGSGQGLSGYARQMIEYGDDLLVVGAFTTAGSDPVGGIARWDGTGWNALPGGGTDGDIQDIYADGTDLYVVGKFDEIGGVAAERVARFDGAAWQGYTAPFQDVNDLTAHYAVAVYDGDLFVGGAGHFDETQAFSFGHLYRFDGATWEQLTLDLVVTELAVYDGKLMIGAEHRTNFPDPYTDHRWLGYYDGTNLVPIFENPGEHFGQTYVRMREIDGLLYIVGEFVKVWDGSVLSDLPTPGSIEYTPGYDNGIAVGHIRDIAFQGTRMFVASHGDYNGFTVWSFDQGDTEWQVVGGGTYGRPYAIEMFQGSLHFAGGFSLAGMPDSLHRIPGSAHASSGFARYIGALAVAAPQTGRSALALAQNRPNPFNPSTRIDFEVPEGGRDVDLVIYDARGRVVRRLLTGFHPGGPGEIRWDGRDEAGHPVASGTYLYMIRAGESTQARKMTLLK